MANSFGVLINSHLIKASRTALRAKQRGRRVSYLLASWRVTIAHLLLSLSLVLRHPSLHAWISNGEVRTQPLEWWVSFSSGPREFLAWLELLSHRDALTLLLCSFTDHVSELGIRC